MASSQSMSRASWNTRGRQGLRLPFGLTWTSIGITAIVMLAAVLRFANIDAIGQANTYYTAAVESMLQSWHNFFFVAAEPGGSVSVDKPPVGLWLQAISAYFLGVNGFAVVLPQIIAGILSVVLLFHLVRRSFGSIAGLIAALVLAVTPVAIAVERNNTPDALLIFTLLLAAWAFIKATETRRIRFLVLGAALVGVGFNIKMMQAFLPLPAFYALYFFGTEQRWWRKIAHLTLATLVLVPISLSWAVIVDLTPADQRPYVGSSENNSALNLAIGYNGIQRLAGGMGGGPGSSRTASNAPVTPTTTNTTTNATQGTTPAADGGFRQDGTRPGGMGTGGVFGTGEAGVLRLFQSGLAAQVSWLLPFGLLMILAMAVSMKWWRPNNDYHRGLILWGGWLLTCVVFFSIAGFFHQYYLAMLGAPLAAIVAMGAAFIWRGYAAHQWRMGTLLIGAAVTTLAFQVYAAVMYDTLGWWFAVPITLAVAGGGLLLFSATRPTMMFARAGSALLLTSLIVIPTVWSGLTNAHASSGGLPEAYTGSNARDMGDNHMPQGVPSATQTGATQSSAAAMGPGDRAVNQGLLAYLQANTQDTTYLMVVPSSHAGAQYVLATGRPVLYAGGFSGSDPVIDAASLAKLVADGDVRYVLWGEGGGRGGNSDITSYLQSSCSVVANASLGTTTSTQTTTTQQGWNPGREMQSTLYQCGS